MKLSELRQALTTPPRPTRNCMECMREGKTFPALFVATGEDGGQWFSCGAHESTNVKFQDINAWFERWGMSVLPSGAIVQTIAGREAMDEQMAKDQEALLKKFGLTDLFPRPATKPPPPRFDEDEAPAELDEEDE